MVCDLPSSFFMASDQTSLPHETLCFTFDPVQQHFACLETWIRFNDKVNKTKIGLLFSGLDFLFIFVV